MPPHPVEKKNATRPTKLGSPKLIYPMLATFKLRTAHTTFSLPHDEKN